MIATPAPRASSHTRRAFETAWRAGPTSMPARASIPPGLAKAFCMSTITSAVRSRSRTIGSGSAGISTLLNVTLEPHDSLRLQLCSRQRPRGYNATLQAHAEGLAEVRLEALGGRLRSVDLHQQGDFVHVAHTPPLDDELADAWVAPHDVLYLRWKEVHTAHCEHVVDPPADAPEQLHVRAAARAGFARDDNAVPGAVADERHAPAPEAGGDELAVIRGTT